MEVGRVSYRTISINAGFALNQFNTKEFLSANSVLWLIIFIGYCIKFLMKILDNKN